MFLVGVLLVATFFIVRVSHFRSQLTPRGNTITAVLSTTQVVHGKHGADGDDEPTAVFTEVFIDSGSGEGFKRPRKQSEAQVKFDSQRKAALPKPVSDNFKDDTLPINSKLSTLRNQSDSAADTMQRHSDAESQKFSNARATDNDNSESAADSDDKPSWERASWDKSSWERAADSDDKRTDAGPEKQDRTVQTATTNKSLPSQITQKTDKSLPSQIAQKASSVQRQAEEAANGNLVLPSLLDPKEVVVGPNQVKNQPQVHKGASQTMSFPAPVVKQRITSVPDDFDWQTYLLYNPELRDRGVGTQQQAEDHYIRIGYTEGMIYKRLRVLLRYTACTGLINQHYSHIAAFSLCAVLGAELVLPPAVKRDSFAHYFSVFKEHNEVKWTPAPLESLLNVDKIIEFWRGRGLTVHRVCHPSAFIEKTMRSLHSAACVLPDKFQARCYSALMYCFQCCTAQCTRQSPACCVIFTECHLYAILCW